MTFTRLLGGTVVLFLIVSLFAWGTVAGADGYLDRSMWTGSGLLAGLLALALLALEGLRIFGRLQRLMSLPTATKLSAGIGVLFAVFTIVEFVKVTTLNAFGEDLGTVWTRTGWAWAGLVLAIVAAGLAIVRLLPESSRAQARDAVIAGAPVVRQAAATIAAVSAPHVRRAYVPLAATSANVYRRARPHRRLLTAGLVGVIFAVSVAWFVAWPLIFPDRGNVHLVVVSAVEYTPISKDRPLYMAQPGQQGLTTWSATPTYDHGSLLIVTTRSSSSQPLPLTASNFKVKLANGVRPTAESKRFGNGYGGLTRDLTATQENKLTLVVHLQGQVTGIRSLHYDDGQGNWGDVNLSGLQVSQPFSADTLKQKKLALFNQNLPALPTTDAANMNWPDLTALRLLARPTGAQIVYASEQDTSSSYDNGIAYVALVTSAPADEVWSMIEKQVTGPLAASGYAPLQNRLITKPGSHYVWIGEQHRTVSDGYGGSSPMTDTAGVEVRRISTFSDAIGSSTGSPEGATLNPFWKDAEPLAIYKLPYTVVEYYVDGPKGKSLPNAGTASATAAPGAASTGGGAKSGAESYIAQVDQLLASSVQTAKSVIGFTPGVVSGRISQSDAVTRADIYFNARDAAVQTVQQMKPPAAFQNVHGLLLHSLRLSRDDDVALQAWVNARASGDAQNELDAVNRIGAQASAAKKRFLAAYGSLRRNLTGKPLSSLPDSY